MKRLHFVRLRTLIKTRFWLARKKNLISNGDRTLSIKRQNKFYFGKFKRFFRISRFFRFNNSRLLANNPIQRARVNSLVRFLYTNKFSRKFWWKVAQRFKRFGSIKYPVRVFKGNLFWKFPFYRRKINLLSLIKNSKFSKTKRKRARYFFSPKSLSRRIRSFYFLNKSKWRSNKDLFILRVRFTLNNLFVTLSNSLGKNLITVSSGALGFKGTTKLTSYAIEKISLFIAKFMKKRRYRNLYIIFNSGAIGYKSKLLIETLVYNSIIVKYLTVSDSIPHNGVRPRKTKRR